MSFFTKKDPDDQEVNRDGENIAITSIIGTGMNFTGDVNFSGKLRLDGTIKGNVKGDHLILGATGSITGDVNIETFTCQGKVNGNINARNLNVVKGCRIDGNVVAVNMLVEGGASLNGEVKVETNDLRLIKDNTKATSSDEKDEHAPVAQPAH